MIEVFFKGCSFHGILSKTPSPFKLEYFVALAYPVGFEYGVYAVKFFLSETRLKDVNHAASSSGRSRLFLRFAARLRSFAFRARSSSRTSSSWPNSDLT